jgi:hypothetical protein
MASNKLFGVSHEVLFCTYGLVLTLLLLSAISYNQSRTSIYSNLPLGFATFFILSDVCLVIGYYLNIFNVFHIERFFYLAGLTTFTIFGISYSKSISIATVQASKEIK